MKRQTNGGSSSKRGHGRKDESGANEEASARGRLTKACVGQCQRQHHAKVTSSMEQRRQARMRPRKAGKETRQEPLKSRRARWSGEKKRTYCCLNARCDCRSHKNIGCDSSYSYQTMEQNIKALCVYFTQNQSPQTAL